MPPSASQPATGHVLAAARIALLAVILATLAAELAARFVPLVRLAENRVDDARVAWLSTPRQDAPNIAVIVVDDASLAALPYRSPVDRDLLSNLVKVLESSGVAAIGLDLLIDRPTEASKDARLRATLQALRVPIVAAALTGDGARDAARRAYHARFLEGIPRGLPLVFRDPLDETVREVLVRRADQPGLAAALAAAVGAPLPEPDILPLAYRVGRQPGSSAFARYAAHEVESLDRSALAGRIVLIGADLELVDRYRTPLAVAAAPSERNLPGVLIQAHALSQILEQRSSRTLAPWQQVAMSALVALLAAFLSLAPVNVGPKVVATALVLLSGWLLGFVLYAAGGPLVPMVAPTLAFVSAAGGLIAWQWRAELERRRFIHDAFGRFLAPTVVARLIEQPALLNLGGESREITYLFTDIEGFTILTESCAPAALVALLDAYLDGACKIVGEHGGTIDKIVGDALHVMFNAPLPQTDHAARAVACALALDAWAVAFARRRTAAGVPLGRTRLGLNSGPAVVGNFGGRERFDYTAHGDTVNTAARLEGANKVLGTRVLVGGSTAAQCRDALFLPVGRLRLPGKETPIDAVVPLAGGDRNEGLAAAYTAAFEALRAERPEAPGLFAELAACYPDDALVAFHHRRLEAGERGVTFAVS